MNTTKSYIPTGYGPVVDHIGRTQNVKVRLRFEPFGRPHVGCSGKGRNRILYAEAYFAHTLPADDKPSLWFEADGGKYLLTRGRRFRDESWELMEEFPDESHLGHLGDVLGREAPDGNGFYPVGVHVEIALPEAEL